MKRLFVFLTMLFLPTISFGTQLMTEGAYQFPDGCVLLNNSQQDNLDRLRK